jgi:hypothetical protein
MQLIKLLSEVVNTGDITTHGKRIPRFLLYYNHSHRLTAFDIIPSTTTNLDFIAGMYRKILGGNPTSRSRAMNHDVLLAFPTQGSTRSVDWETISSIANSSIIWNENSRLIYFTGSDMTVENLKFFIQAYKNFKTGNVIEVQEASSRIQSGGNITYIPIGEFFEKYEIS